MLSSLSLEVTVNAEISLRLSLLESSWPVLCLEYFKTKMRSLGFGHDFSTISGRSDAWDTPCDAGVAISPYVTKISCLTALLHLFFATRPFGLVVS
jgi:hypothetical protein